MSRTAHIVWTCIGLGLMASLLLAAVVWGYRMTPPSQSCTAVEYIISDRSERLYLTTSELDRMLLSADLYPVGKTVDSLSLHRIEKAVRSHPMVRTAECYLTPRNEVRVRLTQRIPLVRVQSQTDTYLIDTDRRVMQARAAVKDRVLPVTGNVGQQTASRQMADFAEWLQDNSYWQERIHHLYVHSPQKVYVCLNDSARTRVVLGTMDDYDAKLAKLRTFLDNKESLPQDIQYTELDIRFHGQVIGRK